MTDEKLRIARISGDDRLAKAVAALLSISESDARTTPYVLVTGDRDTGTERISRNGVPDSWQASGELPVGALLYLQDQVPPAALLDDGSAKALVGLLNAAWYRAATDTRLEYLGKWGADITAIATYAEDSAETHNWCEVYDTAVDELNNLIQHPSAEFVHRTRTWRVTLEVVVEVEAKDPDDAGQEAVDAALPLCESADVMHTELA